VDRIGTTKRSAPMNFVQSIFIGIAFSGPIVIFIGIGRTIMCLDRLVRAKRPKLAMLAGLSILTLLALLAAILAVWFGYGVAHTGKDSTSDLVVLVGTVTPAYIAGISVWYLSRYLEKRLRRNAI
jgi:hypothetical protein